MSNATTTPPGPDEFELTLFGPGFGEAMAVHLGHGAWVLVDSCREPSGRQPAALHYLDQLGLDPARVVRLVVATHWHDDHTDGVSEIVRACGSARVVVSAAVRHTEVLTMARVHNATYGSMFTGLDELASMLQFLSARKKEGAPFRRLASAIADTTLLEEDLPGGEVRVVSLSPSAATCQRAQLRNLASTLGTRPYAVRVPDVSPNDAAVVLWLEAGDTCVLLGSDLEARRDPEVGWLAVLDGRVMRLGRASAYKVAHHGGQSGHEERVWSDMLESQPVALVSPFRHGRQMLPNDLDRRRLGSKTDRCYVTSHRIREQKWQSYVVREKAKMATRTMTSLAGDWGWIRIRKPLMGAGSRWNVELFGSARAIP